MNHDKNIAILAGIMCALTFILAALMTATTSGIFPRVILGVMSLLSLLYAIVLFRFRSWEEYRKWDKKYVKKFFSFL